jgi:hypothetical protein
VSPAASVSQYKWLQDSQHVVLGAELGASEEVG